ncbi:MAG TPA: GYD domain-containing protein [candidate division Zixibacteria bacterium]|nr:GYD domain-containing protein [candidate division Zixibacteria bacterium]MDD4916599.1 GYD domain-containing protein [candidate division Zixibacteria bacterium]MDM7973765.1 GYD domain-containing protein [candidate division Zixibacteria bacterium]HOD65490.1 GYD domain-containing protein [candidate division Zixibacteria bacterium]HOZ08054.1 GYD domain-containing protein [candidate division Zixibacteria bacterium]
MPTFIMAMSIVPSAKKTHPELSHDINRSLEVFHANKVKVHSLYATLGRYDYIAVFDCDDQTCAFRVATGINDLGVLDTETWPVIPYEEFTQLLQ